MKSFVYTLLLLGCLTLGAFALAPSSFAGGGGRAVITTVSPGVAGGKSAEVFATIYKDNDMKLSSGEKGFFRVKNAQSGQSCVTKNEMSDGQAKIYGSCSSPSTGEMEVYIHFPDKVEDATPYKVLFVDKSQEKEATSQVQAAQKKSSTAPCGSGLVSYGWDPANGKSCEPFHFNAWTAYCGNGYQEDVQLDRCTYANELSNDWKSRAEAICNNPRCDAKPAVTTPVVKAKVVVSPTPKAATSSEPTATAATLTATASASPSVATPEPPTETKTEPVKTLSLFSKLGQTVMGFFRSIFRR